MASVEKKKSVNVVSASAEGEKISSEIRQLKELALFYTYNKQKRTIALKGMKNALYSDPNGPINASQQLRS